ncbi:helix-turn-helix transcriptional regulator [Glutamicibacter creatinolyticus]|uniref:helix-turn-helix transcriptional regulator n=1 Tax=Glutamicibacter creatinolyticus TaxID=162496 RepID=UPI003D2F446B
MMTRRQVADLLGVSVRWLEENVKIGPPFYKYSPQVVRYNEEDVKAWLRQRKSA